MKINSPTLMKMYRQTEVFMTCLTRGSVPNLGCRHHIFIWTKKLSD